MDQIKDKVSILPEQDTQVSSFNDVRQSDIDDLSVLAAQNVGAVPSTGLNPEQYQQYKVDIANKESGKTFDMIRSLVEDMDPDTLATVGTYQPDPRNAITRNASSSIESSLSETNGMESLESSVVAQERIEGELILTEKLAELQAKEEDRSWYSPSFLGEVLSSTVPYSEEEFLEDIIEGVGINKDVDFFSIPDKRNAIRDFYWQLGPDDQRALIEDVMVAAEEANLGTSYQYTSELLSSIRAYSGNDEYKDIAKTVVDTLFLGAELTPVGLAPDIIRGAKALSKGVAKREGSLIAQATRSDLEVYADAPVAQQISGIDIDPGVSSAAIKARDPDVVLPREFDPEELSEGVPYTTTLLQKEVADYSDIKWSDFLVDVDQDNFKGTARVHAYVSAGDSYKPFADEDAAKAFIKDHQMLGADVVPGNGEGFFVRITKDVNPYEAKSVNFEGSDTSGWMHRFVLSSDFNQDFKNLHALRHLAIDKLSGIQTELAKQYEPMFKFLRRGGKQNTSAWTAVLRAGQRTKNRNNSYGVWFDKKTFTKEFTSNGGSDVETAWGAYQQFKQLDDYLFVRLNENLRANLISNGFQEWRLSDGSKFLGRKLDGPLPGKDIVDINNQPVSNWRSLVEKGYQVVYNVDKDKVLVVSTKQSAEVSIPDIVLKKTDGGRFDYGDNPFFLKFRQEDVAGNRIGRDITLATAKTGKEADAFVTSYNTASKALADYIDNTITKTQADSIIQQSFSKFPKWGMSGVDEMFDSLTSMGAIRTVGGRTVVRPLRNVPEGSIIRDQYDVIDEINARGSLYTSKRSSRLIPSVSDPKEFPLMDPYKAQMKAVASSIRRDGIQEYSNRVYNTYKELLKQGGILKANANQLPARQIFSNPEAYVDVATKEHKKVWDAATIMREQHERAFRAVSSIDDAIQTSLERVISKALSKSPEEFSDSWQALVKSARPVALFRNGNFILTFWGSIRQLAIQSMSALYTLAASPAHATRALTLLPAMRLVSMNPKWIGSFDSKFYRLLGISEKEFKDIAEDYVRSSKYVISGEVQELGIQEAKDIIKAGSPFWNMVSVVKHVGLTPFTEGERINRTVAWLAARLEKGRKLVSHRDFADVSARADYLTMSMTTASKAWWNDGAAAVPAQWATFSVRFVETLASKKLSGPERLAVGMASLFGFGLSGTVGGTVSLSMSNAVGDWLDSDDAATAAYRGFFPLMINQLRRVQGLEEIPDLDYSVFGPQAADAAILRDLIDLWTGNPYSRDFFEVVLGPTGSIMGEFASGTVVDAFRQLVVGISEDDPNYSEILTEAGMQLGSSFKAFNDTVRAWHMYNYQVDVDAQRKFRRVGVGDSEAFARLLGFETANVNLAYDLAAIRSGEEAAKRQAANQINQAYDSYFATDGAVSRKTTLGRIESILMSFDEDERVDIMDQVQRRNDAQSRLDKLIDRVLTDEENRVRIE